ncbi:hypothetical protein DACRYDRAFT_61285 [Dacryopinax primogenitus]|uniref:Galactose oxidase n=1 Tax=Dacryopinax primogenitus (strain DJM 731) TaxID=1858805 RepID=M5GCZ8_DACPD|nr:uncharacterized protein DACRYDRAFT_61285 [Dacryopinax primogenitus]EJU06525.1 hypothetical protein DACRYDRAFT_61285 [Dacryopinax primogenitus]
MAHTFFIALVYALVCSAQTAPSTNQVSPPLQWINLGSFASGTPPNPVKDALIGYDATSSKLIVFGGSSSAGQQTGETTMFDFKAVTWGPPNTPPGLGASPPARSLAIAGGDYAASYRSAFTMYGGLGTGGPLEDFWSFDFISQFWSEGTIDASVPGPGARYGASGGIDPLVSNAQQLTTSMIMVGGSDGTNFYNDVWELLITGTLSSNNVNMTIGTWNKLSPNNPNLAAAPLQGQANTVLPGSLVTIVGGCNTTASTLNNATCAIPTADALSFSSGNPANTPSWAQMSATCPGGRYGATLAPNLNTATSTFQQQAFMMFGWLDPLQWNGTSQGEVDILNAETGDWSRIIPSNGGSVPSPRYGAVAVSHSSVMVGSSDVAASDTVIFGGVDVATGTYLNELWLLRQFNAAVTSSTGTGWNGFGDGTIENDYNATGSGVSNNYLTQCLSYNPLPSTSTGTSTSSGSTPTTSGSGPTSGSSSGTFYPFDTAPSHKVLSAVSIAAFLPCLLMLRDASTPAPGSREMSMALVYLTSTFALIAYAVGVAGFALAFTSIYRVSQPLTTRSTSTSSIFLQTVHGQAGLALFICLYVLVPAWFGIMMCLRGMRSSKSVGPDSLSMMEKLPRDSTTASAINHDDIQRRYFDANNDNVVSPPPPSAEEPERKTRRTSSPTLVTTKIGDWVGSRRRRVSDSALTPTSPISSNSGNIHEDPDGTPPQAVQSFEVVNRPRRVSGPSRLMQNDYRRTHRKPMHSLSDVSWLERRGQIGGVAELDLVMTKANSSASHTQQHNGGPEFFPSPEMPSNPTTPGVPKLTYMRFPTTSTIVFRTFLFAVLTFACILALVALFQRGATWASAVFLVWTILFYIAVFALAWNGRPRPSSLAVVLARVREAGHHNSPPVHAQLPTQSPDMTRSLPSTRSPSRTGLGPYTYHQPPYHRAASREEDALSGSHYPMSVESGDEEEDDEQRQRQMELEMSNRDVVVMTVPRRQLKIVNA